MTDKIDVDALIVEMRGWKERPSQSDDANARAWTMQRAADALSALKAERDRAMMIAENSQIQATHGDQARRYYLNQATALTNFSKAVIDERDALRADLERARAGLAAVEALIDESRGVDGLHRNGDLATWDELRTGGRYEEWLRDFDAALSPTAPVTGEKEPPGAVLDRAQASLALVEAVINSGRSEEWLRNFETALIAAAKARSTANG